MSDTNSFIKLMYGNINTPRYYPIKRAFGQTLSTCPIEALLAYTKLSNTKNPIDQNIEFLVAGLCYNTVKPFQYEEVNSYVNFEDVVRRYIYADASRKDNREKEVEDFLKLRYDMDGYFATRFYNLAKKVIPYLRSNEQFNYSKLIKDFIFWNNGNSVKMQWAMSVVTFNDTEDLNTNDEKGEI